MTLNEYQEAALRTAASDDFSPDMMLAIRALGLAGEAGEVVELVKKHLGHGHQLDVDLVVKECGDVLWYLATIADACGVSLEDVAQRNVAKLKARYPEGFSHAASRQRKAGDK
jgi:NTP pyrophosphatase (non-canonical NTP hydrolase)